MSVDAGDGHVMTVWDWDKETVIAKTKVSPQFLYRDAKCFDT